MYIDADFAGLEDGKLISGYTTNIGGGCVTWNSKKQLIVALSTMEVEYLALTHGTKQLAWLHQIILRSRNQYF